VLAAHSTQRRKSSPVKRAGQRAHHSTNRSARKQRFISFLSSSRRKKKQSHARIQSNQAPVSSPAPQTEPPLSSTLPFPRAGRSFPNKPEQCSAPAPARAASRSSSPSRRARGPYPTAPATAPPRRPSVPRSPRRSGRPSPTPRRGSSAPPPRGRRFLSTKARLLSPPRHPCFLLECCRRLLIVAQCRLRLTRHVQIRTPECHDDRCQLCNCEPPPPPPCRGFSILKYDGVSLYR
jgi:hypothetical protein